MKGSFTFLLLLMVVFTSIVAKNSSAVELVVSAPSPTSRIAGTQLDGSTPEPTPTATSIPLPQHIWPPALGTSYENGELSGDSHRFDILEPQIFLSFAYSNMADGLPCTIALLRDGEENGEMNWLWDTKMRSTQGRMVVDIMSIIEDLQPGDYAVEISVGALMEQRAEFTLFKSES